ncbi:MAG TPA: PAAR domain-containing protein [Pyrinomonadaceae bacterium]
MPPAARLTDFHQCPLQTPAFPAPIPHVGGPIVGPGAPTVLIGGLPAAKVGDLAICIGPPDAVVKGSATVKIMGLPAARMGDKTAHGGTILLGWPTVMIGG